MIEVISNSIKIFSTTWYERIKLMMFFWTYEILAISAELEETRSSEFYM